MDNTTKTSSNFPIDASMNDAIDIALDSINPSPFDPSIVDDKSSEAKELLSSVELAQILGRITEIVTGKLEHSKIKQGTIVVPMDNDVLIKSILLQSIDKVFNEIKAKVVDLILDIYHQKLNLDNFIPINDAASLVGIPLNILEYWGRCRLIRIYKVESSVVVSMNEIRKVVYNMMSYMEDEKGVAYGLQLRRYIKKVSQEQKHIDS